MKIFKLLGVLVVLFAFSCDDQSEEISLSQNTETDQLAIVAGDAHPNLDPQCGPR